MVVRNIGCRRTSPARVILEQDVFDRSFPSRSFASLEDDTMGRAQRAKTSPRRISGGRKCKRITLKPIGTVRPCNLLRNLLRNKLPAVRGRNGYRCASVYCPKARFTEAFSCERACREATVEFSSKTSSSRQTELAECRLTDE